MIGIENEEEGGREGGVEEIEKNRRKNPRG